MRLEQLRSCPKPKRACRKITEKSFSSAFKRIMLLTVWIREGGGQKSPVPQERCRTATGQQEASEWWEVIGP